MRELNASTLDLSKNIRDKASQESDINLALLNYKMGKKTECDYHMAMAAERGERWRARENKEHEEGKEEAKAEAEEDEGEDTGVL
jgi:hypothetical protein